MSSVDLESLSRRKKSTNVIDLDEGHFEIIFFENKSWTFGVSRDYVRAMQALGPTNEKGKPRINFPQGSPAKEAEMERLSDFVDWHRIPLAEFKRGGKPVDPVLLTGARKEKEIKNILNRFDSACYKELGK